MNYEDMVFIGILVFIAVVWRHQQVAINKLNEEEDDD